jgi:hypothetical protein
MAKNKKPECILQHLSVNHHKKITTFGFLEKRAFQQN